MQFFFKAKLIIFYILVLFTSLIYPLQIPLSPDPSSLKYK